VFTACCSRHTHTHTHTRWYEHTPPPHNTARQLQHAILTTPQHICVWPLVASHACTTSHINMMTHTVTGGYGAHIVTVTPHTLTQHLIQWQGADTVVVHTQTCMHLQPTGFKTHREVHTQCHRAHSLYIPSKPATSTHPMPTQPSNHVHTHKHIHTRTDTTTSTIPGMKGQLHGLYKHRSAPIPIPTHAQCHLRLQHTITTTYTNTHRQMDAYVDAYRGHHAPHYTHTHTHTVRVGSTHGRTRSVQLIHTHTTESATPPTILPTPSHTHSECTRRGTTHSTAHAGTTNHTHIHTVNSNSTYTHNTRVCTYTQSQVMAHHTHTYTYTYT